MLHYCIFLCYITALIALLLNVHARGGGKTGRKAVEQSYASVVATLVLHFGSCHGFASSGQLEPLRYAYAQTLIDS